MGFRINTNIAAMDAHQKATLTNRALDKSLSSLASGLRINSAADDASGLVIADSLRSQANSLGQAVNNANDAIGIIQTADKAMDEQIKILDTIKTKAIQAASDTQSGASRAAIQNDVNRLIEQLDNIAKTTSFNGQTLLSGTYTNKEYQVGAFSSQTITASIGNTQSLAIGNLSTKTDIAQVGNSESDTLTAAINEGSTTISFSAAIGAGIDAQGLAQGDTIRIDGVGDYTITNLNGNISAGTVSSGIITLDRALDKTLSVGATLQISLVQTVAEDLSALSTAGGVTFSQGTAVGSSDITGLAVGDAITFTNSVGAVQTLTIQELAGSSTGATSGTITFSVAGAGTLSNATISISDRASFGTDFSSSDYIQYTVEGTQLEGVQLTDTSGDGVAQSGLGRVADIINSTTDQTGVKAVATVEANSNIRVQAGVAGSDITINGETILTAGTSIQSADNDNTLINAINSKTALTGVSASLESDGTLTLSSDGRAMNISGLSGVAGINDGVNAGTLELIKVGGGDIDVTSAHFADAGLVTAAGAGVGTLDEIVGSNVLSDLVFGQVDDNGDGVIDSNDKVGLLNTREGANLAMDIVESAIAGLDATRADLGSVQNQLIVTVNNISVTAVNVKAAESQIRDVDFAAESANFSRLNILAQSGSYALSQANAVQQNVLRLLQ
ncbi:MAG: hypothetical protein COA44_10980 [Arcobacter sp.]|nr:MAG: hypothetical protein COA44_10980 [Arcobacter sp.]